MSRKRQLYKSIPAASSSSSSADPGRVGREEEGEKKKKKKNKQARKEPDTYRPHRQHSSILGPAGQRIFDALVQHEDGDRETKHQQRRPLPPPLPRDTSAMAQAARDATRESHPNGNNLIFLDTAFARQFAAECRSVIASAVERVLAPSPRPVSVEEEEEETDEAAPPSDHHRVIADILRGARTMNPTKQDKEGRQSARKKKTE